MTDKKKEILKNEKTHSQKVIAGVKSHSAATHATDRRILRAEAAYKSGGGR